MKLMQRFRKPVPNFQTPKLIDTEGRSCIYLPIMQDVAGSEYFKFDLDDD